MKKRLIIAFLATLAVARSCVPQLCPAAEATFAFNPSPSPDTSGYRLYYRTNSLTAPWGFVDASLMTVTVPGLAVGGTYRFQARAVGPTGLSAPSNEVVYTVPPPRPTVAIAKRGPSAVTVTILGTPGVSYTLLVTADFVTWTPIHTGTAPADGKISYTDNLNNPMRFYRAKQN